MSLRFTAWCRTCGRPHGKPFLAAGDGAPAFSISHTHDVVGIAVASEAVGLDIETLGAAPDFGEFSSVALAAREIVALRRIPAQERASAFLRYWTRKEAVLKATGHGLAIEPRSVEVSGPAEMPRVVSWSADVAPPRAVRMIEPALPADAHGCIALPTDRQVEVVVRDGAALLR